MVSNFVLSLIRTYVPMAVIGLLTWLALALDVEFTQDMTTGVTALLVLVVSGLYYLIARWLESKWPVLSVFLGTPPKVSTPQYARIESSSATSSGTPPNTG